MITSVVPLQFQFLNIIMFSDVGTNLKVGGPIRRDRRKIFLVVPFHFFGSKSTISRLGEHFRDGQCSLVSFLFAVLLLTVLPLLSHL